MMKSARATTKAWWRAALEESPGIGNALRRVRAKLITTAAYPAFPSRLSKISGEGWIAVGDAAVAFDPIGGQGVAFAIDTAFRAFEAANVDPSWTKLGADYSDALIDRFDRHLDGRARVYGEAAAVLSEPFVLHAVLPH
jgi:flavin-dependent dehydrogenase